MDSHHFPAQPSLQWTGPQSAGQQYQGANPNQPLQQQPLQPMYSQFGGDPGNATAASNAPPMGTIPPGAATDVSPSNSHGGYNYQPSQQSAHVPTFTQQHQYGSQPYQYSQPEQQYYQQGAPPLPSSAQPPPLPPPPPASQYQRWSIPQPPSAPQGTGYNPAAPPPPPAQGSYSGLEYKPQGHPPIHGQYVAPHIYGPHATGSPAPAPPGPPPPPPPPPPAPPVFQAPQPYSQPGQYYHAPEHSSQPQPPPPPAPTTSQTPQQGQPYSQPSQQQYYYAQEQSTQPPPPPPPPPAVTSPVRWNVESVQKYTQAQQSQQLQHSYGGYYDPSQSDAPVSPTDTGGNHYAPISGGTAGDNQYQYSRLTQTHAVTPPPATQPVHTASVSQPASDVVSPPSSLSNSRVYGRLQGPVSSPSPPPQLAHNPQLDSSGPGSGYPTPWAFQGQQQSQQPQQPANPQHHQHLSQQIPASAAGTPPPAQPTPQSQAPAAEYQYHHYSPTPPPKLHNTEVAEIKPSDLTSASVLGGLPTDISGWEHYDPNPEAENISTRPPSSGATPVSLPQVGGTVAPITTSQSQQDSGIDSISELPVGNTPPNDSQQKATGTRMDTSYLISEPKAAVPGLAEMHAVHASALPDQSSERSMIVVSPPREKQVVVRQVAEIAPVPPSVERKPIQQPTPSPETKEEVIIKRLHELEPFYQESLTRFIGMIEAEAAADSDQAKLKVFQEFMEQEYFRRGQRYPLALGFIPVLTPEHESHKQLDSEGLQPVTPGPEQVPSEDGSVVASQQLPLTTPKNPPPNFTPKPPGVADVVVTSPSPADGGYRPFRAEAVRAVSRPLFSLGSTNFPVAGPASKAGKSGFVPYKPPVFSPKRSNSFSGREKTPANPPSKRLSMVGHKPGKHDQLPVVDSEPWSLQRAEISIDDGHPHARPQAHIPAPEDETFLPAREKASDDFFPSVSAPDSEDRRSHSPAKSSTTAFANLLPPKSAKRTRAPVLNEIASKLSAIGEDFSFITALTSTFDAKEAPLRKKLEDERKVRHDEHETYTNRLYTENRATYADINLMDEEFNTKEEKLRSKEESEVYERYGAEVFQPVYDQLQGGIKEVMDLHFRLSGELTRNAVVGRDKWGSQGCPELDAVLGLLVKADGVAEHRHAKVALAIRDRDRRFRKTVVDPISNSGNTAKLKGMIKHFDDSERKTAAEAAKQKLLRARSLHAHMSGTLDGALDKEQAYILQLATEINNILSTPLPDDPIVTEELTRGKEVLEAILESGEKLMKIQHVAQLVLNSASSELAVAECKLAGESAKLAEVEAQAVKNEEAAEKELEERVRGLKEFAVVSGNVDKALVAAAPLAAEAEGRDRRSVTPVSLGVPGEGLKLPQVKMLSPMSPLDMAKMRNSSAR